MIVLLLIALLAMPAPPPPAVAWEEGGVVVTWQGPGYLTLKGVAVPSTLDSPAGPQTTRLPGAPPVDAFWRPQPGDLVCVRHLGETWSACALVPAREHRLALPLISR